MILNNRGSIPYEPSQLLKIYAIISSRPRQILEYEGLTPRNFILSNAQIVLIVNVISSANSFLLHRLSFSQLIVNDLNE
jgi:hypothetical protein